MYVHTHTHTFEPLEGKTMQPTAVEIVCSQCQKIQNTANSPRFAFCREIISKFVFVIFCSLFVELIKIQ